MIIREELERSIISAIIQNPASIHQLNLKAEYFSHDVNRRIMNAILQCVAEGYEITLTNLYNIGSFSPHEMFSLTDVGTSIGDVQLLSLRLLEEVIKEKLLLLKFKLGDDTDVFDMLNEVRKVESQAIGIIESQKVRPKKEILQRYLEYVETNAREGVKRIPTPFYTLDRMLSGGLTFGDISFVGGFPGSGKTSFMLSLALNATRNNVPTVFIEAEMSVNEILERLDGIVTGNIIDDIRAGRHCDDTLCFLREMNNIPLDIVPCYERTIDELRRKILKAINDGAKFILIDYLQVFTPKGRSEDEYSQIKKLSEMIRQIALLHNVHLCVGSSLNRNETNEKNIGLSSFYGSSQLGHDCSVAILLKGDQKDLQELLTRERKLTIHVVKNRHGARGEINLIYHLPSQRMEEVDVFSNKRNGEMEELSF